MNAGSPSTSLVYKVRFLNKEESKVSEVTVKQVISSDLVGFVQLEGFVFNDQTKHVILPTEDDARKRFHNVEKLHIPYHNVITIEEIQPEQVDLKHLPFVRPTEQPPTS